MKKLAFLIGIGFGAILGGAFFWITTQVIPALILAGVVTFLLLLPSKKNTNQENK